ncbi:GTPase IMAP family member 8-like [Cheilinus undulatus]|uniref:GTPase IMAP family member 8-like n=1 Tax=Cheilinus undulatus TaxID=241271 RepID=UPI001BD38358|nr:GTPase IMAP family member 8-like [Cheilinus undulatus]
MGTRVNERASSGTERSLELRIVLVGGEELTGQSSTISETGNIILGQRIFETDRRTAQSVVRQQEVHSRRVTVVNTPHWFWHYPRENTPYLDQMEIQNSVHLCPPGPHAFLLIIPIGVPFIPVMKLSLMEHLQLFHKEFFKHTIMVFTVEKSRTNRFVEDEISFWPDLLWVLQQCGNRKHALNIRDQQDGTQVQTLLEKIEAMVVENAGRVYSVDAAEGRALTEKMETIAERASKRFFEVQRRRRELRALIQGGTIPPRHLRLVLVGAQWSAKSSAGNIILKKQVFSAGHRKKTDTCEISHSMVANRQLTVVDSPGWMYNHTLQDTNEMDRQEIAGSVHLCPPGPHAVLLVVGLSSAFNASYQRALQEHMSLFTEDVWKHTMVLFTRGDWLGSKTVEERIESEEGLQWLVEKCGNMYHVLDNTNQLHETQVTELLEKIEEMWAGKEEPHYEGDLSSEEQMEARREAQLKTAKRIQKTTQIQSRILKELFRGEWRRITEVKLVLIGRKGSGKSMAANRMLSTDQFGPFLMKKEFQNQTRTMVSVKHQKSMEEFSISAVETPGWLADEETPDWLKKEVLRSVSMCAPGPHAFLLVVPVSKAFTEADAKAVVELLEPLGERVWRHCLVLFTWADWLSGRNIEDYIGAEGEKLQRLVEKCGNRYQVFSSTRGFNNVDLLRKINIMFTRNNGCCFTPENNQPKKQKLSLFRRAKQQELTEEEWNRREQELVDRMLEAVTREVQEPTNPPVKVANSIDLAFIPSMGGDAPSEVSSTLWAHRNRARVDEWLRFRAANSEVTSGIGSMSASASHVESLDVNPLADHHQMEDFFPEEDQMVSDSGLHGIIPTDSILLNYRRHSF